MSALNSTPAELYFREMESDLRRVAGRLRFCKLAELEIAAHHNEQAAAIAYFAGYIAGRKDLSDRLELFWEDVRLDSYYENKSWTTLDRMHTFLVDNWRHLDMPVDILNEHIRPALTWLIWHRYERAAK